MNRKNEDSAILRLIWLASMAFGFIMVLNGIGMML
jgi:hypothetical protein